MKQFFRSSVLAVFVLHAGVVCAAVEELRDVKPPVLLPATFSTLILLGLILFALLGAVFFYLRKQRPVQKQEFSQRLPWEVALERIAVLEKQNMHRQGRMETFYVALSDIIRRYFEEHLSVRAPEMTTEEFLDSCRRSPRLNDAHKTALKNFMEQCDMVKFARLNPGVSEAEEGLRLARKLIEETKGSLAPV